MSEVSTREKILICAHKLFSERGVHAVGIREIAKAAEVNIAAINYHFENKENLYIETIKNSIAVMTSMTQEIFDNLKSKTTEALAVKLYYYFVSDIDNLKVAYKLFLDSKRIPSMSSEEDDLIGPPGGVFFFELLQSETKSTSQDDLIWAVRMIFSNVFHKALMVGNKCLPEKHARGDDIEKTIEEDIIRLVKVIKQEVSSPKFPF